MNTLQRFRQQNKVIGNTSLIAKSLSSDPNVGGALVPEKLEEIVTNTVVRLVPELQLPTLQFDNQKTHEFNRLIKIPGAGSAMGEGATTPTRNSQTKRASVQLKIMRRKGSITGFLIEASAKYMDAVAYETETAVQAFGNDIRTYLIWGNADADEYTIDGLDKFIATNRVTLTTGKVQTNLKALDNLIDKSNRKQGNAHKRVFLMSPELNSQLTSLYTNVRDNRPANREQTNITGSIDAGFRFETYRGIPIIETTGTRPVAQMTAVAVGSAGAGGAIADDEYFFVVAPVTWDGEQAGSPEVSETTVNADTITLSFSAFEDALYYKVYAGLTTGQGNLVLVKEVSAFTYDANGTITGNNTSVVFGAVPAFDESVPVHMRADQYLLWDNGKPEEVLYFWDLDEYQGLGKVAYTNGDGSRFRNLISYEPLAKTDDFEPFLLKTYMALVDSFEATSGLIRNIKTEA